MSEHPALQDTSREAAPSSAAIRLNSEVLGMDLSLEATIEMLARHLVGWPQVEACVVALTTVTPEDPSDWRQLGGRAWVREWAAPAATVSMMPPVGAGPEAALTMPWISQRLRAGVVAVVDAHLLPAEAEQDRRELAAVGIQSFLTTTFRAQGRMFGSLALISGQSRAWPEEHVADLRLLTVALTSRFLLEHERRSVAESVAAAARARQVQHQLFASVGHELRTPLAAIYGSAEMLMAESDVDPDNPLTRAVHRDGRVILRSCEQLISVVDDLLDAGRAMREDEDRQQVDVASAADDVLHWHRVSAESAGVTMTSKVSPGTTVWSNPTGVRQVLANLVGNAVIHNRPGGLVEISTEALTGDVGEQRLRIIVRDSGPGLTPEQLDTVFEPFVRFSPDHVKGNGLGLSLSQSLAERDSGALGVESTPGVGSAFWVELPAGRTDSRGDTALR